MLKYHVAALLLTLFTSSCAVAEDYLLRLDRTNLHSLPNGKQEPDPKFMDSIEIVVRNNVAFYSKMTDGVEQVSVSGKVRELPDGKLHVDIHYRRNSLTGETIPGADGKRLPVRKGFTFDATAKTVELGKAVKTDSLVSRSQGVRTTLQIDHFDPSKDVD